MENGEKDFLRLLCHLYLLAIFAALPLYTGQGYWQLGNTKYILFRNVTLLCLGGWLIGGMPARLRMAAGKWAAKKAARAETEKKPASETADGGGLSGRKAGLRGAGTGISCLDLAIMCYGLVVVISAMCSSYGQLAWSGYDGWFMGAFSQLLFVGIYFFVSRQYDGAVWPVYGGEAAFFLVTVLGLLHRLGIDPLGLMEGWNSGDWEYSHMLSTVGNINWLCGYFSVALAFSAAHYLWEKRVWVRVFLYVPAVLAFVLLGIQGSQGGFLILAVCTAVCAGLNPGIWLILTGFFAGMPIMWQLMRMRGKKAAVPADGNVFAFVEWYVWAAGAVVCLGLFLFFSLRPIGRKSGKAAGAVEFKAKNMVEMDRYAGGKERAERAAASRKIKFGFGAAACIGAGMVSAVWLYGHPLPDQFGSGRGFLWRISLESFAGAGIKDKLLGAGPDCYGEAVFNRLASDTEVWKGEHWEGAVYTNAHNEFLSQLCNVGVLGLLSYLAIFAAGLYRILLAGKEEDKKAAEMSGGRKRRDTGEGGPGRDGACRIRWVGMLALLMYGAHALISFQQTVSTPLLFVTLGMCEAELRRRVNRRSFPQQIVATDNQV